jgi:flagellar motor switch protein FliN/FliY
VADSNDPPKHVIERTADAVRGVSRALIDNVSVSLEAFIGEAQMTIAELGQLGADSVVTLDAPFNQAVELRLNGVLVAKGELVAVGDNFAVRLIEISK